MEAASSSLARCRPQILRCTTNQNPTPSNIYRSQYSREDKRRKLAGAVNAEVAAAAKECTSDPVQFPQSRRKAGVIGYFLLLHLNHVTVTSGPGPGMAASPDMLYNCNKRLF
jgi:hypothetical protein